MIVFRDLGLRDLEIQGLATLRALKLTVTNMEPLLGFFLHWHS